MSNSYNGTTSVLSAPSQTLGTLWSFAAWIFPTSEGQSNNGVLATHGPFGTSRFRVQWTGASQRKLRIVSAWTGSGTWDMVTGFAALNKWLWVGFTMDASAPGNDPRLYTLEGPTFSALTEGSGLTASATTGSLSSADGQTLYLGNNSGGTGTWAGLIGEFAFWKRILSAVEMEAVALVGVNVCPDHFNYLPQDGGALQNLGNSGATFTPTALTAGDNPPVRPAGRQG
jgi:hypothetical protein